MLPYTDETIVAVILEGTGWRVPAARETTQFHPTRGWAEELDEILRASSEGPRYLREQASDPSTPADLGVLYVKDVGGQSELFYRRGGSGTVFQLTPPSAMTLTLQDAYDDGREIVTSSLGPVVLTHGGAALDTHPSLHVRDLNANPGRSQALALFEDANDGAGPVASFVRKTTGPEVQVYHDKASAASNGEVVGAVPFYGHDDAGAKVQYAGLQAASRDVSAASLDGDLWVQLAGAGVLRTPVRLQSNTGEMAMLLTQPGAAAASWPGLTLSPNSAYAAGQYVFGVYNNSYSALCLKVDGVGTVTVAGAVQGPDGSASDTTFRPSDSTTTGIYFTGSGATKATAIRSPGGVVVTVGQFQTDFQGPLTVNTIVDRSGGGAPVTITGTAQVTDGLPAIQLNLGSWSSTSGTRPGLRQAVTFAPTSGTAGFIGEDLAVTVNQTGGANGEVTAHRISLTETAVGGTAYLADWRAGASGSARRFAVDRSGNVTLQSDSAGTLGPELQLYQDSASPAAADVVGRLAFHGEDDGSTKREYARFDAMIYNPAAANPNGRVSIYARGGASGGTMTETFRTYSDQFGNVASGTSRFYTSFLYGGGLTFYGDNQNLTISGGHLVTDSVLAVHSGSFAPTTGAARGWSHATSFAPTSGTAAFVSRDEAMTVNQTGGANGDVTAHRISLTETAVGGAAYLADWRAGSAGTSRRFAVTRAGDLTLRSDSAGALGPTATLLHDSASPAASDELCRLSFQGRDSGANLTEYVRLSAVLLDPTNGSEDGEVQLHAMGAGTLRQALAVRSPAGEAQLKNGLAAGSTPAFRLTATSEYSSSQPVFRIEDNDGGDLLFTVRGDGTTEIGAGEAAAGSASGHVVAFKKHTAFSGSESKVTTGVQTTTNATQTTLWSFTLADNTVYWFEAKVAARRTAGGATADRAGYRLFCCVYREAAGGATLVGTVLQDARESVAAWDATFTVSGNDLRLSVTGETSRTIQWAATLGWQAVSTS